MCVIAQDAPQTFDTPFIKVPSLPQDGAGLRVCHLGKYYPPAPGGIEHHVQTIARAQAALGAKVSVVCVNHANRQGHNMTWRRYGATPTIHESDGTIKVTRVGRSACVAKLDLCPDLLAELARVEEEGIDVLHLHTPNPTMLLALAALLPNTPIFITHHSDIVRQRYLKYLIRPFEHLVYRRAVQIGQTSPEYLSGSDMLRKYESRVESLPLGVDLAGYVHPSAAAVEHAKRLSETHGQPLWLAVGRCVYYKGMRTAIRALQNVPGTLLIIGNGPLEGELRKLSVELGVSDRVKWINYASDDELCGAYHAATALWFPSTARSEGFGLVQVEAMASGCPVINTDIAGSGVPWVSPHEETGLTIAVNDHADLARCALRLIEEPGLRDRLGTAARERACQEFDHLLMGLRSLDLYLKAIKPHTLRPAATLAAHQALEPARQAIADRTAEMAKREPALTLAR